MPATAIERHRVDVLVRPKAWARLRQDHNLPTDQALADALGISQPSVTRVLNGTHKPSNGFIACALSAFPLAGFERLFTVAPRSPR